MSHIEEDDDDFLYGDDTAPKKQSVLAATETTDLKTGEQQSNEDASQDNNDDDDDDDDEGSDDNSDSDIEFIIGSEEIKGDTKPADVTAIGTADAQTASGVMPEAVGETAIETTGATQSQSTGATITRVPGLEINQVGEYEGKPITSLNLQDLKEKPWRQPGADVSEYFNFGFNEVSWTMYCAKQDKLRAQYNPQKMFMELMPVAMMGGMPLPNLPGMPTMPGAPAMPSMPQSEGARSITPTGPSSQLPSGPSRYSNDLPKGPQRQQDYRDRTDRDRERIDYGQSTDFRERGDRYNRRR